VFPSIKHLTFILPHIRAFYTFPALAHSQQPTLPLSNTQSNGQQKSQVPQLQIPRAPNNSSSIQMHDPPMSQQYLHDYDMFTSSHLLPHAVPHSQQLNGFSYDASHFPQPDPYAHFDLSKPISQFQHIPNQHQYQNHSASPSLNHFTLSSFQNMQPPENRRHPPISSVSSDGPPTPRPSSLRVPKFERTYTDALEDELYDESSSNVSQSVNSQTAMPRHATPNLSYPRMAQFTNPVYMDKNSRSSSQNGQSQTPRQHSNTPAPNVTYRSKEPNDGYYHPLANQQDPQRLSSTAVADSVRRLHVPNRTTVSPREAFLDYPDSADFRERTLFSKSGSPYSQTQEGQEMPLYHETDSSPSNDEVNITEPKQEAHIPLAPGALYPVSNPRASVHSLSVPVSSRSTSASTPHSGILSGDMSGESGVSSDSEYDPSTTSARRTSRSSGQSSIAKAFACVNCGKRFDRSQNLQTHRRNSHGRGAGPPSLSQQKFSGAAHQCDWIDPTTGKMCDTVFSRP
jgi:hypothetical protein